MPRKTEENTTQGSSATVDCTLEFIQCSSIKHSVGKVILHSSLGQQEIPCKLGCSTPWYFKLPGVSCGHSSGCRTLVEADESLLNRQWFEFELTLYNILSPVTVRRWYVKKFSLEQNLATEYTWRSRSWRWHSTAAHTLENNTQRLGEQMQNGY